VLCFSVGDGAADLGSDLDVEADWLRSVDLDANHSAMHTSFIVSRLEGSTVIRPTPPAPSRLDPAEREALFEEARRHRRRRHIRMAATAAALLAVATATGGAYKLDGTGRTTHHPGAPLRAFAGTSVSTVVFVVDVSGSMQATDVGPTRLDATVAAIRAFLTRLPPTVRVGLISFSQSARVLQTPTVDRSAILSQLATLTVGGGTALGTGLVTAINVTLASLKQRGITPNAGHDLPAVIMLESDGAQNRGLTTPLQAAQRAKALGIRIDGVALGTPGGVVRFGNGSTQSSVPVPPDPQLVRSISRLTGGASFTVTNASRFRAIYQHLGATIR
jgi:Mg-chelatase subunit ChlD